MENYYEILGVAQDASQDDIKKAYRALAHKHHPDKGGNEEQFKKISVAYDTLKDEIKKAQYDAQLNGVPHMSADFTDFSVFEDILNARFNFRRANKDINVQCHISFADSFNGKQLELKYILLSTKEQEFSITIPPGVLHGSTVRYRGLGDDSNPNIPRGNLNLTVIVEPDENFFRRDNDLCTLLHISPIEAMIGCVKKVKHIDGKEYTLNIRPGVETGVEYSMNNKGFKNPYNNYIGRFLIIINIKTPAITDEELIQKLTELNQIITQK